MYLPIHQTIDITPITDRLDAVEAMGPAVTGASIYSLKHIIIANNIMLVHAQDGDPVMGEDGEVAWSPEIADEIRAENDRMRDWITELEA